VSLGKPFVLHAFAEPLGYTKAVNAGISIAKGEYVILLNNDVVLLDKTWIDILTKPFVADDSIGMTGAIKEIHPNTFLPFLVFFCVMTKKSIINKIGLLDEVYNPGYGEDIDYCARLLAQNYKILQVPVDVHLDRPKELYERIMEFPIYHGGNATVKGVNGWSSIVDRNEKILIEKYGFNKKILYSVVLVAHNYLDQYLRACIDGLFNSTGEMNTEIIIVANSCDTKTKAYLATLGRHFQVHFVENYTYADALQYGYKKASGEYVILMRQNFILGKQDVYEWTSKLRLGFTDEKVAASTFASFYDSTTNSQVYLHACCMLKRK
jgi:glycosyltransferase involved in cell wall biosynthesis